MLLVAALLYINYQKDRVKERQEERGRKERESAVFFGLAPNRLKLPLP